MLYRNIIILPEYRNASMVFLSSYLWGLPLFHSHTVKTLDEVVEHLRLFTGLYGKAVATWVTSHPPSGCTQARERKRELWEINPAFNKRGLQSVDFLGKNPNWVNKPHSFSHQGDVFHNEMFPFFSSHQAFKIIIFRTAMTSDINEGLSPFQAMVRTNLPHNASCVWWSDALINHIPPILHYCSKVWVSKSLKKIFYSIKTH